jgi:hypothetical protein
MLHRIVRIPRPGFLNPRSLAALRRNLTLALCAMGIMISTGVWMILLAQPAHATNCNGNCGPDSGACTGAGTNCATGYLGFCSQAACTGIAKSYANVVAQGTTNSLGVRTVKSTYCSTSYTCGFVTVTNQTCASGSTCSPKVGPNCTSCGITGSTSFSYSACTLLSPCNEG